MSITPYLQFDGNCREAITFYHTVLGGELHIGTVGESPMAEKMPAETHPQVMHANLTNGTVLLMASDRMGQNTHVPGSSISLSINCSSDEEIDRLFAQLSEGGHADMPLQDTFWNARFGFLTDKFGIQWMLNFDKK